jgi:hypothetical protein
MLAIARSTSAPVCGSDEARNFLAVFQKHERRNERPCRRPLASAILNAARLDCLRVPHGLEAPRVGKIRTMGFPNSSNAAP